MNYKLNTVYHFEYLNKIGGTESHLYYLAKKYKDRDWVITTSQGSDIGQIARLSKLVPVIVLEKTDTIECERFFTAYNREILDRVTAKEVIFVSHANYVAQCEQGTMAKNTIEILKGDKRITRFVGVSKTAVKGFDAEVVYMPIELDKYEEPILLVSATRLTPEKGLERMRALAKMLDDAKVNYLWHVYTNSDVTIDSPNVQFLPPRLDIVSKLPLYDGLVQLSDSEAFCISMQEALMSGVPLISTPLPVIEEDFHLDDRSVIIFPFDMKESGQIEKIRNIKKMKVPKYSMPEDKWGELLTGKRKDSKYQMKVYRVKANSLSYDRGITLMELGRVARPDEIFETIESRIDNLVNGNNVYRKPFAEVVDEEKE